MTQQDDAAIQCSYCRGFVPARELECPRCGAPLPTFIPAQEGALTETGDPQEQALEEMIEKSHQDLIKAGTSAAELAFGVGCTLGVIVGGALIVIIFLAFTKTWTILAVISLILALISFLVSSYLSTRAREATTRATYEREIKPEIDQFIAAQGISHPEFYEKAVEILPEDAPLLVYQTKQEAQ